MAFQALFEAEFGRTSAGAALARELDGRRLSEAEQGFAERLIAGVIAEAASLDATIGELAPAHPVSALGLVERVLLRIALYELLFNNAPGPHRDALAEGDPAEDAPADGVPVGAVINEAVELAKTFGSDASRRFVNGVLGTVSRERLPQSISGTPNTEMGASRGAV